MGKASVREKLILHIFYDFRAKTCRFFLLDCLRFLSKNLQAKQAIEKPVRTL